MRKSSDQRSVDSSPRLIAASYVLHRLLVPRHPPCALNNLTTQTHPHPPTTSHRQQPGPAHGPVRASRLSTRCSRPLCSSQTTNSHPDTAHHQTRATHGGLIGHEALPSRETHPPPPPPSGGGTASRPVPSGPNSVPTTGSPSHHVPHPPRTPGVRIMKRYLRRQEA